MGEERIPVQLSVQFCNQWVLGVCYSWWDAHEDVTVKTKQDKTDRPKKPLSVFTELHSNAIKNTVESAKGVTHPK